MQEYFIKGSKLIIIKCFHKYTVSKKIGAPSPIVKVIEFLLARLRENQSLRPLGSHDPSGLYCLAFAIQLDLASYLIPIPLKVASFDVPLS